MTASGNTGAVFITRIANCRMRASLSGVLEKPLLFGERMNGDIGDTRSRHTYRKCLPRRTDEDAVAISTKFKKKVCI